MTYWRTLAQVVLHVAKETGKPVTEDDILEMAEQGHIQVSARLPIRKGPGNKEAQWYRDDGAPVGMASVATDGVLRGLDQYRLQQLLLHDGVDLAGARWDIPGGSTLIAGPEAGFIGKVDICVAEPECRRILAVLSGEATSPLKTKQDSAPVTGLPKKVILSAPWPLPDGKHLDRLLSDVPKWLAPAKVADGAPGKGPHTWNPAMMGYCMMTPDCRRKWVIKQQKMTVFLGKYFNEWLPEFERLCEYEQ